SGAIGPSQPTAGAHPRPAGASAVRPGETAPLDEIEREHILEVLRQVNGNRMAAAKLLGISRRALYRRLERHQLVDEAPPACARTAAWSITADGCAAATARSSK